MTTRIVITLLISLCLTVSCTSNYNSVPDIDKAVMQQIFPSLVDSMYIEITFSMTPPPIAEMVDSITGRKELKPVEKGSLDRQLIRNTLSSCEQDSNYITIVLSDSIHALFNDDLETFKSKYSLTKDTTSTTFLQNSYLLPLNDFAVRACFKLILSSKYQPTSNDSMMYVRQLKEFSFSRIIFNSDKTHGMLTCEYVCGTLCGNGYRVFIKQVNTKWVIDYIEHAWIA